MPEFSVIIPTHNRAHTLHEAIDSALAQTYPPHEIIVADDGSTDGTRRVVASYGKRVRFVHHDAKSPSRTRNLGIRAMTGDVAAFLDSDDVWVPRKLEIQAAALRANPGADMALCNFHFMNEAGRKFGDAVVKPGRRHEGNFMKSFLGGFLPVATSGVVIRKSALDRTGGFDQSLYLGEDFDLWIRVALGGKTLYSDESLCTMRVHPVSISSVSKTQLWLAAVAVLKRNRALLARHGIDVPQAVARFYAVAAGTAFDELGPASAKKFSLEALRHDVFCGAAYRRIVKSLVRVLYEA
jgi:glycosyltransferase involved in cell wall biosynthesis